MRNAALLKPSAPAPLRNDLAGHSVKTAHEMGWSGLDNGNLLREAENQFDLVITTDQNLRYQQNLKGRKIAILVLSTTNWPRIEQHKSIVVDAVNSIPSAGYTEIQIPK